MQAIRVGADPSEDGAASVIHREPMSLLACHPAANAAGDEQAQAFKVKEVIQPQVPLRLPCYDFVPVMNHTVVTVLPKVRLATSGAIHSHDVTGGVYKARERIHRDILIHDY